MKKKSFKIIFLDKDSSSVNISKKAVVILSPSFYWFTKERLNVPLSQAKKIAASIFEGIAPQDNYSYYVEKIGDEYWFFAYKDENIIEKLSSLGIKLSQISKVYPAQLAFASLQEPVTVENKIFLNENGTVVAIPKNIAPIEAKSLEEIEFKLPKNSLPIKAYSNLLLSEDLIYKFSIAIFIAILLFAVQVFMQKRDLAALEAKKIALMQQYHLPATSIQLKSIMSSLERKQKEQLDLREKLDFILHTPLQKKEFFQKLDFGKRVLFEIANITKARAETIKRYLAKKFSIESITLDGKNLIVKCRR